MNRLGKSALTIGLALPVLLLVRFASASGECDFLFPVLKQATGLRNVANFREGVRVQASSTAKSLPGIRYSAHPAYAIDGDSSQAWSPSGEDSHPWLRIGFRAPRALRRISVNASRLSYAHVRCTSRDGVQTNVPLSESGETELHCASAMSVEVGWDILPACTVHPVERGAFACYSALTLRELTVIGE